MTAAGARGRWTGRRHCHAGTSVRIWIRLPPLTAGLRRLAAFTELLRATLGSDATISTADVGTFVAVSVEPRRTDALEVGWLQSDDQVVLSAGSGGRWELEPTAQDVQYLEDIVRAVVAGRVTEVRGRHRSRVEVTLADGMVDVSTVYDGFPVLLPHRGWSRLTPRVYAPYQ